MIVSAAALAALRQNFKTIFQQAFQETPVFHETIATTIPSDTEEEIYTFLDDIPEMREWLGARQVQNIAERAQALKNKLYEGTVGVKRTHIEDDKLGRYRPKMQDLGMAARQWPDALLSAAMQAGSSTVCYDGQYFFDTDHPVDPDDAGKGVQSNLFTGRALDGENLQYVITQMMSLKKSNGAPLGLIPSLLVVPPQKLFLAKQLLQTQFVGAQVNLTGPTYGAATQNNVLQGMLEPVVFPRLANEPDSWYVLATGRAIKPFIFQSRTKPEFQALTEESENSFKHDEFLFGARARGAVGYGPWFLAAKASA